MRELINKFAADESGAVTVDWVVLTAALVGLGMAVVAVLAPEVASQTGLLNDQMEAQVIKTTFD